MYTRVHKYITRTYPRAHTHKLSRTQAHTHTYIHTHTQTHTHTHTHTHTCICTHSQTHIDNTLRAYRAVKKLAACRYFITSRLRGGGCGCPMCERACATGCRAVGFFVGSC